MQSKDELNKVYNFHLRTSLITSLALLLIILNVFPKQLKISNDIAEVATIDLVVEDIPRTEQVDRPPPPARPVVPIPTEDEDVPEDLTIENSEIDFAELPPPPPPPKKSDDEGYTFIAYDSAPEPIGGFASMLKHIQYPAVAKRAGVECNVIVGVLIDEKGNCVKTVMLKDSGAELGFEEAAQNAVRKMKWKPALQRDQPIKVWVSVPVSFRLTN
jgi:periplasmic protein TonB